MLSLSHETVLYGLVKELLADFLPYTRDADEAPLPKYVENEVKRYLSCGDFSRGFRRELSPGFTAE